MSASLRKRPKYRVAVKGRDVPEAAVSNCSKQHHRYSITSSTLCESTAALEENGVGQDKWHQGFCSKLKRNALIVMNVDEGSVLNGARGKAYYVNEQRTCRPKVV